MSAAKVQDMPPPGGYKSIIYHRIPAKTYLNGWKIFAIYTLATAFGFYMHSRTSNAIKREDIEIRSARNVMIMTLMPERDREYLKQLRRNRDEEASLMANVPGWEVGTWYGEPIYKTLPKDKLIEPLFHEFYAHADESDIKQRAHLRWWH